MESQNIDLSVFAEAWKTPYVERSKLSEFSNGALDGQAMVSLDLKGEGIKGRISIGGNILYPVQEVVAWMEARTSLPEKGTVDRQLKTKSWLGSVIKTIYQVVYVIKFFVDAFHWFSDDIP